MGSRPTRRFAFSKRSKQDKSLNSAAIHQARQDPDSFIEYCFSDKNGNPLQQGDIHREWQEAWTHHARVLIEAPRDHGKTSQLIGRTIWELGRNPNLRIKIVCQSDGKAVERLTEIRTHIEKNERVHEVFPELKPADEWSKHRITVQRRFISKDPSIEAQGIMSSSTGGRCDLLIADDVVDLRNALLQPALREQVKLAWKSVWINLLEPDGRVWYIATPWHQDDLTHWLRKNGPYHRLRYPVSENFDPVWPEVWNREALIARYEEIGSREFGRAFRLVALSDDDMTFPSFAAAVHAGHGIRLSDLNLTNCPRYTGADIAGSKRKGTVLFTLAMMRDGKRVPVEIRRGAWKSPRIVSEMVDAYRTHKPQKFYVENNGVQTMVVDWLQEAESTDWIPVQGFHTGKQKADPSVGLPSLEVELSTGGWVIPAGEFEDHEADCGCGWCVWVAEVKGHPVYSSTDCVMAWWFAREAARTGGVAPPTDDISGVPKSPSAAIDEVGVGFDGALAFGGWMD